MGTHAKCPVVQALEDDPLKKFGARLKALREQRGLTQPELAAAMNDLTHDELVGRLKINPSDISRWERGVNLPHARQLYALTMFFGVSADYLLGVFLSPSEETEAFTRFRQTRWGRLAQENGWLDDLRAMRFPMEPTVDVYTSLVKSFLDAIDRGDRRE